MHLGVIASAGGSAFEAAAKILLAAEQAPTLSVLTDRGCGAETRARELGLWHDRIEERDNRAFSVAAQERFAARGVDAVLLFFTRLVTEELFTAIPTFNIHPSLLPAFAGFRAVKRAAKRQVRFGGATLHLATADADVGPIVAQCTMPLPLGATEEAMQRYAFVHKVALNLLLVELIATKALTVDPQAATVSLDPSLPAHDRINPALRSPALWQGLVKLQQDEGLEVIAP